MASTMKTKVLALALEHLHLNGCCAAAAVCANWRCAVFQALAQLRQLSLAPYAARVDDAVLATLLPRCERLDQVNLCNCRQVTDAGLLQLLACPTVTALNLSCMPAITADGVEKLCNALPIQSLELSGCSRIREVDLVKRFGRFIEFDDDEDGLNKVQG
ncbi:Fbxl20 [Symbiodinium sp. KB8]|nr:Fbxl20 [Symbiodinium sp. KB8]